MLNLSKTRPYNTIDLPGHPDYPVTAEGQFLIGWPYGNINASGPASEVESLTAEFHGIARLENIQPQTRVEVYEGTFPVPVAPATHGSVNIPFVPVTTGDISVTLASTAEGLTYAAGTTPTAVQFGYANASGIATGIDVFYAAANGGKKYKIILRRSLTVLQASLLYGDQPLTRQLASAVAGTIPVIQQGPAATDQFDVGANWLAAMRDTSIPLTLTDNGRLTVDGAGLNVRGLVQIQEVPSPDNPFLLLNIFVA
jgi:hypothetical protein